MVATDPSEDAELPTTRLQATSAPCLGLILRCPSFLHVHSLLWFMFPFTDNTALIPFLWLHLWCGHLPLCWSRLFSIVLRCITNLSFPWHHTPFVLAYSSFTWSHISLIDHSHPPYCLCFLSVRVIAWTYCSCSGGLVEGEERKVRRGRKAVGGGL